MTNPDPEHITEPMWKLWTDRPNTSWKLGGIYAIKKGYHNTVKANALHWPDNYSVRFPLDLVKINNDKARGIDLTMTTAEMIQWTTSMRDSALNTTDDRLAAVREFYGTLDGKTVYGLIKDDSDGPWRRAIADLTHLWHGHVGIFTAFVNDWKMLAPLLSVWNRETFTEWKLSTMVFPKLGDTGDAVAYWQLIHNTARKIHTPPAPEIKVDSNYGSATAAAFTAFYKKLGGTNPYNGQVMSGWMAMKYHQAFVKATVPPVPVTPPVPVLDVISVEQLKELVNAWLVENLASGGLNITGEFNGTGKVTL